MEKIYVLTDKLETFDHIIEDGVSLKYLLNPESNKGHLVDSETGEIVYRVTESTVFDKHVYVLRKAGMVA